MTNVGVRNDFDRPSHRSHGYTHFVTVKVPTTTPGHYETKIINEKELTTHKVECYHVSCKSYKPSKYFGNEKLGGIVLYLKDSQTDWYCNGIHCKIGVFSVYICFFFFAFLLLLLNI